MFINDVHIFGYLALGILGLLVGEFVGFMNFALPRHDKLFSKDNIKNFFKLSKVSYTLALITSFLYIMILYFVGSNNLIKLVQYLIITPLLISAFTIDCKLQIIPNRLTLTIWEVGLIFSFIRGIMNLNVAIEMWIGMLVGAGIFLVITLLGNLIFRKETMGFGDVKLMGAIGLFFGWRSVIVISIISFFIAAIYSIVLITVNAIRKKKVSEFIPFGPFIVLATMLVMFIPLNLIVKLPFYLFVPMGV